MATRSRHRVTFDIQGLLDTGEMASAKTARNPRNGDYELESNVHGFGAVGPTA